MLIARGVDGHVGFHDCIIERRPIFQGLFLFHLADVDDGNLVERRSKRDAVLPTGLPVIHSCQGDCVAGRLPVS